MNRNEDMNIVFVGHVDHGKSTIIGRLLADTNSLPSGKLDQVREMCRKNSKPFEYAFLLDALKDEQMQGITIDSARCFFKTGLRNYIIIDAPGHMEFLKNMVTGAARAEAALLVIDADEGIQENSTRHGFMLSMLGIKQVCVLVNKMDLVGYCEDTFNKITGLYSVFLEGMGIKAFSYIPVSGINGDNIVNRSDFMKWYRSDTLLETLDKFKTSGLPADKPLRMPIQGVYKFTKDGDDRRIIAGSIESGRLSIGDEVIFYPSGKKSKIKSIEAFNSEQRSYISAGYAAGFTLDEQIYVRRGEMASLVNQSPPKITTKIKANLFWLGKNPMEKGKVYYLKLGTAKVKMRLEEICKVIDSSSLQSKEKNKIHQRDAAECILKLDRAIAFDTIHNNAGTSRFVIVDGYEISGGGIVHDALDDKTSWVREKVSIRDYKWEKSEITDIERAAQFNQRSCLILITGQKGTGKKAIARTLEKDLFKERKIVYFLGIGNLLYGVDADIKKTDKDNKSEHLRRLGELAHILLEAGMILIVTAVELTSEDLDIIKTVIDQEKIKVVWVGKNVTTEVSYDLQVAEVESYKQAANSIKDILYSDNIIFKPW